MSPRLRLVLNRIADFLTQRNRPMPYRVLPGGASSSRVYLVDGGGNGDHATIQAALNAAYAQSPSADNRWLVLVGPGSYSESLSLFDFVDLAGLAPGPAAIVNAPAGQPAIASPASCWLSNLRLSGSSSPLLPIASAGWSLVLDSIVIAEDSPGLDGILLSADSVLTLRRCDLQTGGDTLAISAGTLRVEGTRLAHFHTNPTAPTEYPLVISGGDALFDHCVLENLGYAGSGVHFIADPKNARLLQCTIRKASGAYAISAAVACASASVIACVLNAAIDATIGVASGNTIESSA